MKKKILKPIYQSFFNKATTIVTFKKYKGILEVFLSDFQGNNDFSFKYTCKINDKDIDKDYCWLLDDFSEVFEKINGRMDFVIQNNKIVYADRTALDLPKIYAKTDLKILDVTENNCEITVRELECFKNFDKMRCELKAFPEIGSRVFFSVDNNQLFIQSMTGYSAFEMFLGGKTLDIENSQDYSIEYECLKNLSLNKLGITGCNKGVFKVFEKDNQLIIIIKMVNNTNKGEIKEILYNIHTQRASVQIGEKFFKRYLDGINKHSIQDIDLTISEDLDIKSLKKIVTDKNKKEGGVGKKYKIIFNIVDGCIEINGKTIRLFDKNYPEKMRINGYDLLTILSNGLKLHYGQDDEYFYIMNYCQMLTIKK